MDSLIHARGEYDEIHSRANTLFGVQLAFLTTAGLCVLARAYVKVFIVKRVLVEDWLIFGAMAAYTAYGGLALHGVVQGATGKGATELTREQAVISLRAWYLCEVLYSPITLAIRTSICLLLLRLAVNKVHRWIIYGNLVIVWLISIAFFFIMTFQCMPPSYFWRQLYGDPGSCINYNIVPDATVAHSTVSALSDWCMGLLPIAILWNVNLNRRTKVLVAVLLSMGMGAGIALVIRIPYVKRLAISVNFLYETIEIAIWSVMEPALGIIAASVTSMRPLFQNWGFGWSSSNKNSGPSGPGWANSSGHPANRQSPVQKAGSGLTTEKTNPSSREYDDIERALSSPTDSCIELNETRRGERGGNEHEYSPSRPSSDLGETSHVGETQDPLKPGINIRTTIQISSHSFDHETPSTSCTAGDDFHERARLRESQPRGAVRYTELRE